MRILQVVHQFLPRYIGGTEHYTARAAAGLVRRGHDCMVFAGGDQAGDTEWEGLPVRTTPGGLRGPKGPAATFLTAFRNPEAEAAFVRTLDEFRPDVVQVQHLLGLSPRLPQLAAARGVPVAVTLHDYWFECANGQLVTERGVLCDGPVGGLNCAVCGVDRAGVPALALAAPLLAPAFVLRNRRIRAGLGAADVVLAPSDFIARRALAAGLDARRVRRVTFGVPEEWRLRIAQTERQDAAGLRIAYVGSIAPRKGVAVLLDAFLAQPLRGATLTICGGLHDFPDYVARLQERARGRTDVCFTGAVTPDQVAALLADSDVLAVPSLWYENAPLVLGEARAVGLPVLASNAGALAEQVRHGEDGLLFRMGDAADLAGTLLMLQDEPDLLARLRQGVRPPPAFTDHLDELEAIYAAMIRGGPGSLPHLAAAPSGREGGGSAADS
ncbi:MAG: glycosyltransferase family 4 protein [Chloroflexi bacterium]|nr:glycosyltransferase family 4 protein [Chloroflexota bacterium]